jgi:RNA polymerase sigma-70 factor (ECF subfamily)
VTCIRRNDGTAGDADHRFTQLYREHADALVGFFMRRTYSAQVAMDLTAETFAVAFEGRASFRGRTDEDLVGWLYGIARNQLRRYSRRGSAERRALARLQIPAPQLEPEDIRRVEEQCYAEQVLPALTEGYRDLPKSQRDAVELRVLQGQPYEDVASTLGITVQAARVRVFRGLARLGKVLGDTPAEEGSAT